MSKLSIQHRIIMLSFVMIFNVLIYLWYKNIYFYFDFISLVFMISMSFLMILVHNSKKKIYHSFYGIKHIYQKKIPNIHDYYKKILLWSKYVRVNGLISLEESLNSESNIFVRQGLNLLINTNNNQKIENILMMEIEKKSKRDLDIIEVYRKISLYLPLTGSWAAIINLMNISQETINHGLTQSMIMAMQPIFYGIFLGSVVFYSLYEMLKSQCYYQYRFRRMITEGLISIGEKENPFILEKKLMVYLNE